MLGAAAQQGHQLDAFGLLGLPEKYDLDAATIESAFFAKSRELHADKFATAPADERVHALSRSRAINDAYQLLKRPTTRAEYLLARQGVTIGNHEQLDPAFLMQILELREQLADARTAGDMTQISVLQIAMTTRRDAALSTLPALFRKRDLAAIKSQLIALRYLERYLEECDAALDGE